MGACWVPVQALLHYACALKVQHSSNRPRSAAALSLRDQLPVERSMACLWQSAHPPLPLAVLLSSWMAQRMHQGRVISLLEPYLEHELAPVRQKAAQHLMVAT